MWTGYGSLGGVGGYQPGEVLDFSCPQHTLFSVACDPASGPQWGMSVITHGSLLSLSHRHCTGQSVKLMALILPVDTQICVRVKRFHRRFNNFPHLPVRFCLFWQRMPIISMSYSLQILYVSPYVVTRLFVHKYCQFTHWWNFSVSGWVESPWWLLFNFTGVVPMVPGYGGGYPQQYYQGTACTHVCAQQHTEYNKHYTCVGGKQHSVQWPLKSIGRAINHWKGPNRWQNGAIYLILCCWSAFSCQKKY